MGRFIPRNSRPRSYQPTTKKLKVPADKPHHVPKTVGEKRRLLKSTAWRLSCIMHVSARSLIELTSAPDTIQDAIITNEQVGEAIRLANRIAFLKTLHL